VTAPSDPFESTAHPDRYVPREATERALARVETVVRAGGHPVAVTGPVGLGKTLLLQVLARRVAGERRVVTVPYPALSAGELCAWILDALGEPRGSDPQGALLDLAFRSAAGGRGILLLLDDASALPPRTARSLATLVAASGGALGAVFAALDDARLNAALAALGPDLEEVRLDAPMSEAETLAYIEARLASSAAGGPENDDRRARFDASTCHRLHLASAGIPRRLHHLASVVWRAPDPARIPGLLDRWVAADDEGRVPDFSAEPAEAPAHDAGAEAGTAHRPGPACDHAPAAPPDARERASERQAEPEPYAPVPPPEMPTPTPIPSRRHREVPAPRSRMRGWWVALLLLAAAAVAMPYALPRLEALWSPPPSPPVVETRPAPEPPPPAFPPTMPPPAQPPRELAIPSAPQPPAETP